jgi:hypothetical protein
MCFGGLGDDCQNLLDDLRMQYGPAVKGHRDLELAFAVDPMATLRAKVFEGRE